MFAIVVHAEWCDFRVPLATFGYSPELQQNYSKLVVSLQRFAGRANDSFVRSLNHPWVRYKAFFHLVKIALDMLVILSAGDA